VPDSLAHVCRKIRVWTGHSHEPGRLHQLAGPFYVAFRQEEDRAGTFGRKKAAFGFEVIGGGIDRRRRRQRGEFLIQVVEPSPEFRNFATRGFIR
jgi:hypothetical protein